MPSDTQETDESSQVSMAPEHDVEDVSQSRENESLKEDEVKSKKVTCFPRGQRMFILLVLLLLAAIAGGVTFWYLAQEEDDDFESQVEDFSREIEQSVTDRLKNVMGMVETLAVTIGAYAQTTNATWSFQTTLPNYETIVSAYASVTGSRRIATAFSVPHDFKEEWEAYSVANQGWIQESFETLGFTGVSHLPIHPSIYNVQDGHTTEALQGPFLPLWQMSPPPKDSGVVNQNLMSSEDLASLYQVVADTQQAVLSQVLDVGDLLDDETISSPASILLQPIVEQDSERVIGVVLAVISWTDFLSNLVQPHNSGMVAVLRNTCGQSHTYELHGHEAVYLEDRDVHDRDFNEYKRDVLIQSTPEDSDKTGYCNMRVSLYPTIDMEDEHGSNAPLVFCVIIGLFICVSVVGFLVYDYSVRKAQQEVLEDAERTNAIVSQLYPEQIRDQLIHGKKAKESKTPEVTSEPPSTVSENPNFRLKNYLNENGSNSPDQEVESSSKVTNEDEESKPIADLFPSATILFADIAGFTAWSSVREPSQVFTLLETVFRGFDNIAKRRKVFKVETVGDCYVAVAGLPERTDDHPEVMSRFARDCLDKFNELVRQLEVNLGPDTGDLDVRMGLHTGPVTAGVLRGAKSRFQLFGDTVNTAARIESSGKRNRIHLSHETAERLHKASKQHWLSKRNDTIVAKGKGEMQTYWLLTNSELATGSTNKDEAPQQNAPLPIVKANAPRLAQSTPSGNDKDLGLPPKILRLVDWNVDVLTRLLKQIVAKRNVSGKEVFDVNHPIMMKTEVSIGCDTYVLDEVTEIIRLPGYSRGPKSNKVELPSEAKEQLRDYVSSIASMHRDNAFHNFEHASHVMMSVNKLLSRIVAPSTITEEMSEDHARLRMHDNTYGITSDPLTQFSVVLAALIHDVDHSGVSNFQLIKENAKIAKAFKNKSVAEQNSTVLAWDKLMESKYGKLRESIYSDPDELKRFRQLMVNTVLATDIFDKELQTLRKNRWEKAFPRIQGEIDESPQDDINRKATIVIEHLIQASDVAHTMQHWHVYQKWNERLFHEMTVAFQAGRMAKDPAQGWYEAELGFFDNYVIPLAKKLKECGVFGVSSDEYLNYALENRREWSSKGEAAVATLTEKYSKDQDKGGNDEDKK